MSVTLHLGDCLEYMRGMADKSVDAVITDPPYLLDNGNGSGGFLKKSSITHRLSEIESGFDESAFFVEVKRICKKVNAFIFCSNRQIPSIMNLGFENGFITNLVMWNKTNVPPFSNGTWLQDVEFIVHIRESGATFQGDNAMKRKVYTMPKNVHETDHPAEKPVKVIERYLKICSNEDATIFDPFMGSGTTGVAAVQLGRNFIGCEINPDYYAIAQRRIRQAQEARQLELIT
jgi:site-specific DNA-methyltransferase (adenine-specific)